MVVGFPLVHIISISCGEACLIGSLCPSRLKMHISLLRSHGSRMLDYIYGAIIFLFQDPSFKMNSLAGISSSNVGG